MSKIITIEFDGDEVVHIAGTGIGDWLTLCSMDNDDTLGQKLVKTRKGALVNCTHCIQIWNICHTVSRDSISWYMHPTD